MQSNWKIMANKDLKIDANQKELGYFMWTHPINTQTGGRNGQIFIKNDNLASHC